jgi:hypothetical protein
MTVTTTSPSNTIDLIDLEHELRKARDDSNNIKPRIASKEDIQRDRMSNGGIHCPSRY